MPWRQPCISPVVSPGYLDIAAQAAHRRPPPPASLLQGFGFDVVELNASDARSKKALQACAEDLVGNTSIADFAAGGELPTPYPTPYPTP